MFNHPACQERHYVLSKLTAFLREHDADDKTLLDVFTHAGAQLPDHAVNQEADSLSEHVPSRPGRGPNALGRILLELLEQLRQRVQYADRV